MTGQDRDQLVHVAGPFHGGSVPGCLVDVSRHHVIEGDARPRRVPLDVHEVAQRKLEQVHPVDEPRPIRGSSRPSDAQSGSADPA